MRVYRIFGVHDTAEADVVSCAGNWRCRKACGSDEMPIKFFKCICATACALTMESGWHR